MICGIIVTEVIIVRITTSKSKNSESFYITQSYTNANGKSTSKTIRKLGTLEEQGFMPVYERQEITDDFHETCGFKTDYQFITKRKMKGIQKKSKRR